MGRSGEEPLTLTRCHSFMNPLKGGDVSVAKPRTYEHKGENFFFISFSFTNLLFSLISWHMMRADPAAARTG